MFVAARYATHQEVEFKYFCLRIFLLMIKLYGVCIMNYANTLSSERTYKDITASELIENIEKYDDETYIQISGVDIALRVSLLNNSEKNISDNDVKDLLQLYYDYLKQGNKDGFCSAYLETKFKNVRSILKKIFSNSYPQTFRISS